MEIQMRRHIILGIGSLLIAGCPAGFTDLCDNGACDNDASLGDSGIDAPPGCDLTKDPKDSLPCVDDSIGIFVDATNGKDSNLGTKSAPMQTIAAGLGKTNTQHARLYICEGTYPEDVTLDASHDGVSLYGGWKCADWSYAGTKPLIGKTNMAGKIDSLVKGTTIEDVAIQAADATNPGDSSIAMFVNASQKVALARVSLNAGVGVSGVTGTLTPYTFPTALDGNGANGDDGGIAKAVNCPAGDTSTGGKGGTVSISPSTFPGDDGLPNRGAGDGGVGGATCVMGDNGGSGAAGNAALATAYGSLSTSWGAMNGADGGPGGPGQGGGGGGAASPTVNQHGGGGSGGGGACGGAGGGGGGGGGSSFALVSSGSGVNVTASSMVTKNAGNGGNGVAGQTGQSPGGLAGAGVIPGCNGGGGGAGGSGGGGGGGAGGLSVGVFYKGTTPVVDGATQSAITIGNKGSGGTGASSNNGVDGDAQSMLECQSPLCN
jgi:hypothetical protein